MKHENDDIKGMSVVVSGFGNVAWGICKKLAELGAKAVTLSGPDGYIYDPEGVVVNPPLSREAERELGEWKGKVREIMGML